MYLKRMYDNILIDGKNILYRATAAARSNGYKTHAATIVIRILDRLRRTFKPNKWHVFWDVPKEKLWRTSIYPEYKSGRPTSDEEYASKLSEAQKVVVLLLRNMKITQYIRDKNEADDLIYAFVKAFNEHNNLIISSDRDVEQITYHLGVDIHNPDPNKRDIRIIPKPKYDPVLVKSLAGDKSDNIKNYRLVKDKTAMKILDKGLSDYLDEKGRELFDHNRKLVDLSMNPHIDDNISYIKSIKLNEDFNINKIQKLIAKYNIDGLYENINSIVIPFKYT